MMTNEQLASASIHEVYKELKEHNERAIQNFGVDKTLNEKSFNEMLEEYRKLHEPERTEMANFFKELGFDFETVTYLDICPTLKVSKWTKEDNERYSVEFERIKKINEFKNKLAAKVAEEGREFLMSRPSL